MMTSHWTDADNSVLILERRAGTRYVELAALLDRSVEAIRKQIQKLHREGRIEVRELFEPSAELADELMRMWNAGVATRAILGRIEAAGHKISMSGWGSWVRRSRVAGLPLGYRREERKAAPEIGSLMRLDLAADEQRFSAFRERVEECDDRFARALRGCRFEDYPIRPGVLRDYPRPATVVLRTSTAWE